jgi:hypothetical protein
MVHKHFIYAYAGYAETMVLVRNDKHSICRFNDRSLFLLVHKITAGRGKERCHYQLRRQSWQQVKILKGIKI